MGTFFGRRRTDPVGIEFALDLTAHTVTLFERAQFSGWKRFASAELDDPEFPIVIGLLRTEAETHAGGRHPVRIWLPPDQVLRRRANIDGATPEAQLQSGFDYVARETVYRPEDVAIAVAPEARNGEATVLITFAETWQEARDYVQRWGFLPGAVSTRSHAGDFDVDGPVFRPQGQEIAQQRARPRNHFAVAASVALAVTGAALAWGYQAELMALIGAGPGQQQAEAPALDAAPAPAEATELAAAQPAVAQPNADAPIAPAELSSKDPADPPHIAAPAETLPAEAPTTESTPGAVPPGPSPVEPAEAPRPVEQAPLDTQPQTQLAAALRFDLAPPRHVATVPDLVPRAGSASMPNLGSNLGPGLINLAAYTATPAGPANQTEATRQPSAPPGPALPDPKLSEGGAWSGLTAPAEIGQPMPKLAALDLANQPAAAINHNDVLAALGITDPVGKLPLPAPSHRPQIGAPVAEDLGQHENTDLTPGIAAPADDVPATEASTLTKRSDDSAGLPPPAPEPPEPADATKYAAKFAPLPPRVPGRALVGSSDQPAPDAATSAALAPTGDSTPDTGADIGEAGSEDVAAEVPAPPFAAYDPAEALASLDITIVSDLKRARTSLPFPPPAPNRETDGNPREASTAQDLAEPSTPTEDAQQTVVPQTAATSDVPTSDVPASAAAPETSVAYDPAELMASLDITVVPDLDKARASLPFPPAAPGRTTAAATTATTALEEDETSDDPGIGPPTSARPQPRPAHLTRVPAQTTTPAATPDAAAPDPAQAPAQIEAQAAVRDGTPPSPTFDPATIAALLPHGALIPDAEPNPDAPTRYASLTSPYPSARPSLPAVARSLPGASTLKLPKLSPGSVREAATEQGLPLDRVALIGVLDLASGRKALLRMPDGRYRSVVTGDTLDGWRVSLIGVDAMRITRSGKNRTLLLVNR